MLSLLFIFCLYFVCFFLFFFFFSSRRRHTRLVSDWSSDVCSSDLMTTRAARAARNNHPLTKPAHANPSNAPSKTIKSATPREICPAARGRVPGRFTRSATTSRRSEEHTSELQSLTNLVCRLLLEKK